VTGQVVYGSNNIYTVRTAGGELQCRIRGKILATEEREHNPLAVGDRVEVEEDPLSAEAGWIVDRAERTSAIVRFNRKRRAPQVLAANVDYVVCVSSVKEPPFRPRFLDRLLISAAVGGADPVLFLNKCDLPVSPETEERIENYEEIGYPVIRGSALTGEGVDALAALVHDRTVVVIGQSGVGKTALLNRLEPGLDLRVGDLSRKYDRGAHTTTFAILVELASGGRIIDTPGIRELEVHGIRAEELSLYYPEFEAPAAECRYYSCNHLTEDDCAVREAARRGEIHPDRYEGYLRLFDHLKEEQSPSS
jgi:ribosome biogenesis GTPase